MNTKAYLEKSPLEIISCLTDELEAIGRKFNLKETIEKAVAIRDSYVHDAERRSDIAMTDKNILMSVVETRPEVLNCDVVRFQNKKEKWVALVGLLDGMPYEIFTGLQDDEEGIMLPKSVTSGRIIKVTDKDGNKRYDFQFENKKGYKTTIEGLSEKFNPEYWNYAKLISGVLRYRMPLVNVVKLVGQLQLGGDTINSWKSGVERALKKYIQNGTEAQGLKCPNCSQETLVYEEGSLICKNCGYEG